LETTINKMPLWRNLDAKWDEIGLVIGNEAVMQWWERDLMRFLARQVTRNGGRILEIGFGLGISANFIAEFGCEEYVLIEPHPAVLARAREFAAQAPMNVEVIPEFWQEVDTARLGHFDGILFDAFPMTESERYQCQYPFLPVAASLLKHDGIFTYYSDETSNFRCEHLKLLLANFNEVAIHRIDGLSPPDSCRYWKHDHMMIPVATSPRLA
jgi:guanidinoacetate N-methyltransferase